MKKIFFIVALTIAYLLVPAGAEMSAQVPDSCLKYYIQHPYAPTYQNPDSVKADSCEDSPTFGVLYAKKYFMTEFKYNIIPRDTLLNKDTILEYTLEDILATYPETISGFQELKQMFGNFWLRDFYPDIKDTTTLISRCLYLRFEKYVNIDALEKFMKTVSLVNYCHYIMRIQPSTLVYENKCETSYHKIIIFPQPANDKIYIKNLNADDIKEKNIKLVNILGIVINCYKFNTPEFQIDVSDLPNGMYYLISNNLVKQFIILR